MAKPSLDTLPCPRCGYATTGLPCTGCGLDPDSTELDRLRRRGGLGLGIQALGMGARLVWRTPGAVRRLAVPAGLTLVFAVWLHRAYVGPWIGSAFRALDPGAVARREPGPLRSALEVLSGSFVLDWLAGLSQLVGLVLVAWFAFGFVFEALAGPFLDTLHAQLERSWFGLDAKGRAQAGDSRIGSARSELRMLGLSALAALLAALVAALALPLLLVPGLGGLLYLAVSGAALSLGALDVAFSRRRWTLRQRIRLLNHHWPCALSFGTAAGALLGIPFAGPLLVVPCASLGGLWMLIQLDLGFAHEAAGQPSANSSESHPPPAP